MHLLIYKSIFTVLFLYIGIVECFQTGPTGTLNWQAELELEYNPSNYVLRLAANKALAQHIDIVTKASDEAREAVPHKLNVRYGPREGQLLDIYGTDLPKGSPIFVYLHGGYWQELNKDISAYPVKPLWREGIICIVGGYDLAPNATLEVIVQEARELAVFVLKMASQENCNVWFGGHSAGGHLCASLLEAEWYNLVPLDLRQHMSGVVLISGIYDLSPLVNTTVNKPLHLDRTSALQLSPMFKLRNLHLMTKELRALVIIGEHDSPAFHGQAAAYSQVLKSKKIRTRSTEILGSDIDHYSIVANLQYSSYSLTQDIISLIHQPVVVIKTEN